MHFINKAMSYYIEAWQKCIIFKGRTSRKAFWSFQFINFLIFIPICFIIKTFSIENYINEYPYYTISYPYYVNIFLIYPIAIFLPQISSFIRRFHDTGKSGWMVVLLYIPIVNIWPLVLLLTKGDLGHNKYGSNPEER